MTTPADGISLDAKARRVLWLETSAVLLMIATPAILYILCWIWWRNAYLEYHKELEGLTYRSALGYTVQLVQYCSRCLYEVPILLFVMWRSGDGWAHFGLVRPKWEKDIILGIWLWLLGAVGSCLIVALWSDDSYPLSQSFFPAPGRPDFILLCLLASCAIGFSEELSGRAYLIPRLKSLTGSTWASVALSAVIFGLLHVQRGLISVVGSVMWGVIWGISFGLTRRLWPVAIAHALTDFVILTHLYSPAGY